MAITCRKDICSKYLKRGPSSLRKDLVHTQDTRTCRHNAATGIVSAKECLLNPDNMLCPYRAKHAHALVLLHHLYFCLNSSSVTMRSPQPLPSRSPDASMSPSHRLFNRNLHPHHYPPTLSREQSIAEPNEPCAPRPSPALLLFWPYSCVSAAPMDPTKKQGSESGIFSLNVTSSTTEIT